MTEAYDRYLACRDELLRIRTQVGGGYWCEEEEPVIEEMDALWSRMEPAELAAIRAQGSWKFPPPPAAPVPVRVPPSHGIWGPGRGAERIGRHRSLLAAPAYAGAA